MESLSVDLRRPLRRLLNRSWGRIRAAELAAGYRQGYLARIARGEVPAEGRRFYRALIHLGVDATDFVHRATLPADPESLLEELPQALREPRALRDLRSAARRVEQDHRFDGPDETSTDRAADGLEEVLAEGSPAVALSWLRRHLPRSSDAVLTASSALDEMRFRDPQLASRLAQCLAVEICPNLEDRERGQAFCAATGVYASSRRALGDLESASAALRHALPLAFRAGPRTEARLLQRVARVLGDYLRTDAAIALVSRAGSLYGQVGDPIAVAKTVLQRGLLYAIAGRATDAIRELGGALKALPDKLRRDRASALQTLGRLLCAEGQLSEGKRYLRDAEELTDREAGDEYAALLYARAEIAMLGKQSDQAIDLLREARRHGCNPFDQALATLDLLTLAESAGKQNAAEEEKHRLRTCAFALQRHPIAQAALLGLYRRPGIPSASLLAQTRSRVCRERARRT